MSEQDQRDYLTVLFLLIVHLAESEGLLLLRVDE